MEKVQRIESGSFMLFGKNGNMQPRLKIANSLPRGMKVIYSYYAGNTAIYGAVGDGRIVLMSDTVDDCFDGEFFSYKSYMNDKDSQPIEEKFGIGIYYCENEEPFKEEEICKAELNAGLREKNRIKYQEECKRISEEKTAMLKEKYNFLTLRYNGMKKREETDNVRKLLKNKYPNTKFSVRYESFSGGNSITVEYTDGPKLEDVEKIVRLFQDSHSDYSGDYYDYDPSEFNNLFGGFKYVHVNREFSKETIEKYADIIRNEVPALNKTDQNDWRCNDLEIQKEANIQATNSEILPECVKYSICRMEHCWNRYDVLARSWAYELDLYINTPEKEEKPAKTQKNNKIEGDFEIVDYSEKAIALIGDTKSIKEQLKELGGRFNPRLSCGAGWIFSKKKEQELRDLLNK